MIKLNIRAIYQINIINKCYNNIFGLNPEIFGHDIWQIIKIKCNGGKYFNLRKSLNIRASLYSMLPIFEWASMLCISLSLCYSLLWIDDCWVEIKKFCSYLLFYSVHWFSHVMTLEWSLFPCMLSSSPFTFCLQPDFFGSCSSV